MKLNMFINEVVPAPAAPAPAPAPAAPAPAAPANKQNIDLLKKQIADMSKQLLVMQQTLSKIV